jgi:Cu/Ag efflux pump CusA
LRRSRLAILPALALLAASIFSACSRASSKLSPILMTALVTGVGLIPLALGKGKPGKEIHQPMTVVILGGIFTSTFLNMIVIPTLYLKFANVEEALKNESPVLRDKATVAGD